jgi:hypothetical protein
VVARERLEGGRIAPGDLAHRVTRLALPSA